MTCSHCLLISLLVVWFVDQPAGATPDDLASEVASADYVVALPSGVVSVHCGALKLWHDVRGAGPVSVTTIEACVEPISTWGHSVTFLHLDKADVFDLIAYQGKLLKRPHGHEFYSERTQPRSGLFRVRFSEDTSAFEFFNDVSGETFMMQAPHSACLGMRDYPLPVRSDVVLWQKCGEIFAVEESRPGILWSRVPCGKGRESILVPSGDFSLVLVVCIRGGLCVLDPLAPNRKYRLSYADSALQAALESERFALGRVWMMKSGWLVTGRLSGRDISISLRCSGSKCRIEKYVSPIEDGQLRFYGDRLEANSVLLRDGEQVLESDGNQWFLR